MGEELFDAHLDLAAIEVNRRDMELPVDALDAQTQGPWPPASVTLPELDAAGVRWALATIFTEADGDGPEGYRAGDAQSAHDAGAAQLNVYERWERAQRISIAHRGAFTDHRDGEPPMQVGILVECADPIRDPDELPWWVEHGVVAVGMAWAKGSRYAPGNGTDDREAGLTDLGINMVRAMDDLGVVHDLSHLSDRAAHEVLERSDKPVIASHSNCRALLGGDRGQMRHLSDELIRAIAARGGVIGTNLFSMFLRTDYKTQRPTAADVADHIEHVCAIAGSRACVGLGSDADGGFGADMLPEGLDRPTKFAGIGVALRERGWSEAEVTGYLSGNWRRFWRDWNARWVNG